MTKIHSNFQALPYRLQVLFYLSLCSALILFSVQQVISYINDLISYIVVLIN